MSGTPIASEHIYSEACAGRMGARMMAMVVQAGAERVYLSPTSEMEAIALTAKPTWKPELEISGNSRAFSPPLYGMTTFGDLFTSRQLVELVTISDLFSEALERIHCDARLAILTDDAQSLDDGGDGPSAYAEAVTVYLAFAFDKLSTTTNTICTW